MLFNLMGVFWLTSGLALIRRPERKRVMGKRVSWGLALIGILTGLLVISRNMTRRWVPEIVVVELLSVVILLTGVLHIKRRHMTKLLNAVFNMRYVAILAVIVPFFGAALMFLLGTLDTVNAYLIFFGLEEAEGTVDVGEATMVKLVASVDHFLFASILIIFALGLYYFLFRPAAHSGGEKTHKKHLSWNQLKNLGGMDEMLLKVIIMLLAVANLDWTVLVVPLTIIALALGLRWMQQGAEETDPFTTQPEPSPAKEAYLDELERLSELQDQGVISEDEFTARKKQILSGQS
jgi:uncharacterized membrane protein YqhA